MEVTEVRIKLMDDGGERLQAFCSITLDHCFVIRDLKIIDGTSGPFVAMPSRKLTSHCTGCGCKNHLRAAYCNQCGRSLPELPGAKDEDGRAKLYADIAHPINSSCRELIQLRVIAAFRDEIERAKLPGYVSSYDDFDDDLAPTVRRPRRTTSSAAGSAAAQTKQPSTAAGSTAATNGAAASAAPARGREGPSSDVPILPCEVHPSHTLGRPHVGTPQSVPKSEFGAGIFEKRA